MTDSTPSETAASSLYARLRRKASQSWRKKQKPKEEPTGEAAAFGAGRDPRVFGDVLSSLTLALGWDSHLAESHLSSAWLDIVGPDVATHAQPRELNEGTLTVVCDTTAWATQLRLMESTIITNVLNRVPEIDLHRIIFLGPNAPTFKRGMRSVPGRGPRDTFG